ncbi:MAG: spermidine/putrescine ABC transporter substrate-binding protein [Hyphomicrobiales bacterium]|uniref:ABC transporter substrate-binding protein n=1 Tax=Aestuariivirga sp. TaxID=2650926 RepID=UPI0035AFA6EB
MTKHPDHISASKFIDELRRYQKGSVSRRHFLGVTGLGLATAVLSSAVPGLRPRKAYAGLSGTLNVTTWPNYFSQENYDNFTKQTGVPINVNVFGSNEEMLAKLQAGSTGWDVLVPTNYTISTYKNLDLIEPLDLKLFPNYDPAAQDPRFLGPGTIDGVVYAVPKDWGTTGFIVNTKSTTENPVSWKDFFALTQGPLSGKVTVHDYQLTTIGSAAKALGYSFNTVDPKELAEVEKLLIATKPHLFGITSDYQPAMRNGDAVMAMCWTNDAAQLNRDLPEMSYRLGKDGGEIWVDHYAVIKGAPNRDAAYAFLDYILTPAINAKEIEAHGTPTTDSRVIKLLPESILKNPILYPAADQLSVLEYGAAETLTNPARAELMARFKSA